MSAKKPKKEKKKTNGVVGGLLQPFRHRGGGDKQLSKKTPSQRQMLSSLQQDHPHHPHATSDDDETGIVTEYDETTVDSGGNNRDKDGSFDFAAQAEDQNDVNTIRNINHSYDDTLNMDDEDLVETSTHVETLDGSMGNVELCRSSSNRCDSWLSSSWSFRDEKKTEETDPDILLFENKAFKNDSEIETLDGSKGGVEIRAVQKQQEEFQKAILFGGNGSDAGGTGSNAEITSYLEALHRKKTKKHRTTSHSYLDMSYQLETSSAGVEVHPTDATTLSTQQKLPDQRSIKQLIPPIGRVPSRLSTLVAVDSMELDVKQRKEKRYHQKWLKREPSTAANPIDASGRRNGRDRRRSRNGKKEEDAAENVPTSNSRSYSSNGMWFRRNNRPKPTYQVPLQASFSLEAESYDSSYCSSIDSNATSGSSGSSSCSASSASSSVSTASQTYTSADETESEFSARDQEIFSDARSQSFTSVPSEFYNTTIDDASQEDTLELPEGYDPRFQPEINYRRQNTRQQPQNQQHHYFDSSFLNNVPQRRGPDESDSLSHEFDASTIESGSHFDKFKQNGTVVDIVQKQNKSTPSVLSLLDLTWPTKEEFMSSFGGSVVSSQISALYENPHQILTSRTTSAVTDTLWEADNEQTTTSRDGDDDDNDDEMSKASSAFAKLPDHYPSFLNRNDSSSTGVSSAFVTIRPDKTEKARVADDNNNNTDNNNDTEDNYSTHTHNSMDSSYAESESDASTILSRRSLSWETTGGGGENSIILRHAYSNLGSIAEDTYVFNDDDDDDDYDDYEDGEALAYATKSIFSWSTFCLHGR